ncbi:MAG TPA: MFS transporter [Burkholderiales bacterium]|nr:MFS transporter [Burkholderiales bacterium]
MKRHILGGRRSAEEAVLGAGGGRARIPETPHTSHMHVPFRAALMVAIAAGLGYGFDAYAVNLLGMLGPLIIQDLNITVQTFGLIGSIFLVGYTIGTIGFGWLADRIGRRDTLGYSILIYGFTTAISGLTHNVAAFTILRFLTGIGGAGELAVGAPYTAEMWPKKVRALGTGGIMFSLYSAGYILAAIAALFIVPRWGWEWTFIFAAVPAVLVFVFRRIVQESARFKVAKLEIERREREDGVKHVHTTIFNIWKIPGAPKRIFIGWLLYVANACGYWGITVFLTTFMVKKFGLSTADAIFWAMMFYIVQFVLSYVGTGLSDWAGRRFAGILGALIMIGCTVVASLTDSFTTFAVFGAIMIGMLGWLWGVGDTYLSEFFHTTRRGTGFGLMVGGGRVASIFAPALVGYGIAAWGPTIPFLLTSCLWILTIIGYAIGPETAGRELEEVQI